MLKTRFAPLLAASAVTMLALSGCAATTGGASDAIMPPTEE